MISNAVPVDFAEILAKKIITDLKSVLKGKIENSL